MITDSLSEPQRARGTVLVASASDSFLDIVGHMIGRCGFVPAYCAADETAASSLIRTHPRLVVCDGDLPAMSASRIHSEAQARGIPLLMSLSHDASSFDALIPPDMHTFTFPLGKVAFSAIIEELVEPSAAAHVRSS